MKNWKDNYSKIAAIVALISLGCIRAIQEFDIKAADWQTGLLQIIFTIALLLCLYGFSIVGQKTNTKLIKTGAQIAMATQVLFKILLILYLMKIEIMASFPALNTIASIASAAAYLLLGYGIIQLKFYNNRTTNVVGWIIMLYGALSLSPEYAVFNTIVIWALLLSFMLFFTPMNSSEK